MPSPSSRICSATESLSRQLRIAIVVSGGRIFGGVVEQVEQHLLEQHGIELAASAGRPRARATTLWCARILPARRSALPTISPRSCSAVFGTMAPDSSLVMSSRLAMKRLSRSDSSMIGARADRASRRRVELAGEIAQRAGGAEHRGERRLQIVRDRGQQRRAQPVGLDRALDPVHVLDQCTRSIASAPWSISASSSRRWSGVSSGPGLSLSMPTTPIGAAAGAHRQEQPLGAGQRVGAAAGGAVVLPGPVRGGEIGLVERVLRRIAGLHRRCAPSSGSSSTTRTFSISAV